MPSATDLGDSVHRFVTKAISADKKLLERESAFNYIRAAEQSLAIAWLNSHVNDRTNIAHVQNELRKLRRMIYGNREE